MIRYMYIHAIYSVISRNHFSLVFIEEMSSDLRKWSLRRISASQFYVLRRRWRRSRQINSRDAVTTIVEEIFFHSRKQRFLKRFRCGKTDSTGHGKQREREICIRASARREREGERDRALFQSIVSQTNGVHVVSSRDIMFSQTGRTNGKWTAVSFTLRDKYPLPPTPPPSPP